MTHYETTGQRLWREAANSDEPAWVLRMEKATDQTGYRCSGFEANAVAKEWRQQQAEIERLRTERDEARDAARWMLIAIPPNEQYGIHERWPWLESGWEVSDV